MTTSKKLAFSLLLVGFLVLTPFAHASADSTRYFVKTTKSFWKNALGVRNVFDSGFTTDLSDFQVKFGKMWGLDIQPVKTLQILPDELASEKVTPSVEPSPMVSPSVAPSMVPSPSPSSTKKNPKLVPTEQVTWGVKMIYDDPTLTKTSGGSDIKVAVLDTGVATNHPDLQRRVVQCKDFTVARFSVIDSKCDDKNGHGTYVAGIIAADGGVNGEGIYGVAPDAEIYAYKVCDVGGMCYADDVATAIRTAADQIRFRNRMMNRAERAGSK